MTSNSSGSATISRGHSRYLLPQGAGVLVDPITVRFATTGAELEAGLAWQTGTRIRSRIEIGLGSNLTRSRTQITSAVRDVTNRSTQRTDCVYTSVRLSLRPKQAGHPELRLESRAKYAPDAGVSIQTGLALAY